MKNNKTIETEYGVSDKGDHYRYIVALLLDSFDITWPFLLKKKHQGSAQLPVLADKARKGLSVFIFP